MDGTRECKEGTMLHVFSFFLCIHPALPSFCMHACMMNQNPLAPPA